MRFLETAVRDARLVEIEPHHDSRGLFGRVWCADEFAAAGTDIELVQANTGFSYEEGTLRGLHFQREPFAEWKLARCTLGAVFDVVVDLRSDSDSYLRWFGVELTSDNRRSVLVPPGCAHGYQTLAPASELLYLTSNRYEPKAATGVRFNDPAFSISWPLAVSVISDTDRDWPNWTADDARSRGVEQ